MTFTDSGRLALLASIFSSPFYLAWGSGLDSWAYAPPVESKAVTALATEIGRRLATTVSYVAPDPEGPISAPYFSGGSVPETFSLSETPTLYLYFAFQFAAADAPTSTIREVGLYLGGTLTGSGPYYPVANVSAPGKLLAVEYLKTSIVRTNTSRQLFEFVFTL